MCRRTRWERGGRKWSHRFRLEPGPLVYTPEARHLSASAPILLQGCSGAFSGGHGLWWNRLNTEAEMRIQLSWNKSEIKQICKNIKNVIFLTVGEI